MNTAELEAILAAIAEGAGIAGALPTPASIPLLLFAGLEGPTVQLFAALFHKIHHSSNPSQAARVAVGAAHIAIAPYVDTEDRKSVV